MDTRLDHGGTKQLSVKTLCELLEALEVFYMITIVARLGLEIAVQPL